MIGKILDSLYTCHKGSDVGSIVEVEVQGTGFTVTNKELWAQGVEIDSREDDEDPNFAWSYIGCRVEVISE